MGERRLLPYIHRYSQTPSVYYDDELPQWYRRRRYPDSGYYDPPAAYHRGYARRYYDDYLTHRSLPALRHYDEVVPTPRAYTYRDYRDYDWQERQCARCRTLPRISSKLVPSMHYDELRCRHCEGQVRRDDEKVMAYPWTPNENTHDETLILRRVEEEPIPHETVSAPAQLVDNRRKVRGAHQPRTAPPFLYIKGREKDHLLSEDDARRGRHGKFRPPMFPVREELEMSNEISPDDSISNVGIRPFRPLPLVGDRPRYSAYSEGYFHTSPRRVDDSPHPIRTNHPRRHFDGHYVDIRNGKKYKYKVNYMDDGRVDSERRQLRSL